MRRIQFFFFSVDIIISHVFTYSNVFLSLRMSVQFRMCLLLLIKWAISPRLILNDGEPIWVSPVPVCRLSPRGDSYRSLNRTMVGIVGHVSMAKPTLDTVSVHVLILVLGFQVHGSLSTST